MREYLEKLPKEIRDLLYLARDIGLRQNVRAYLVGGFVRDLMLRRFPNLGLQAEVRKNRSVSTLSKPRALARGASNGLILGVKNLDLDIVVEGDGIRFAENFACVLKAKLTRHARFGTATIMYKPHFKIDGSTTPTINPERVKRVERIDVATARRESYPKPAQLPSVIPGALKDDLFRRDFTINAMAIQISGGSFGSLADFFGGRTDLMAKKIRILHNLSFIDDPTRILRAIRFEQRYGFVMEAKTMALLKAAVRLKMLERVQPQRLRDELILILKETSPLRYMKRMRALTGFNFVSRHLSLSKKHYALFKSIEAQINWFNRVFPRHRKLDAWLIYFSGLMEGLSPRVARGILKKFVFSKGEEKRVLVFKKIGAGLALKLSRAKTRPSIIFNLLEPLSYETIILLKAKYKNPYLQKYIADFLEIYNGIRLCVSGEDLRRLGLAPGPRYQQIFAKALKAKLEGEVKTKKEELALIKRLINRE